MWISRQEIRKKKLVRGNEFQNMENNEFLQFVSNALQFEFFFEEYFHRLWASIQNLLQDGNSAKKTWVDASWAKNEIMNFENWSL